MLEQRSDSTLRLVGVAIGLALVVHAGLLLTDVLPAAMRTWRSLFPRPAPSEPTQVELLRMTPDQFDQHRRLASEPPRSEVPPDPPLPHGQVVDVAPTPERPPPQEARFLSEHGSRVDQETASQAPRPDYDKPQPRPSVAKAASKQRPKSAEPEPQEPRPSEKAEDRSDEPQPTPSDTSQPPGAPEAAPLADSPLPSLAPQEEPADVGAPRGQAVAMAESSPDQAGGAPAPDRLRDVRPGEATFLNSAQFVYATFFNRVKQQIAQFWHPAVRDRFERFDLVGRGPTLDELQTLLVISLKPDGALESVELARSCGVAVLDDLALRSVHQAAPFPNPPRALVSQDGRIRFAFGFSVSQRYGASTSAYRIPGRYR